MPKTVDIYVLETKIGSGQFGDVFRGYSKVDGTDVAIKTIQRSKIKGKFTQLLQNQIQVLKSCKNNNVIQLIDIKKTSNNIYLILQYCNQGDLNAYLKQKKKIPEDQALQYFVQILHAFQTLVKNKIMHRDFKLANVLKHDGSIKIADFGFAKLLGSQDQTVQTILGSPLNMAPQVLDHQNYNSKADIWSIGVAFYQLLFGKVPYTAANIIELLKKIKKDPLVFPHKVHPHIEDVLRKMLVVDSSKRIQWSQLFKHPVTRLLQDNLEQNLKMSMLCKKQQLPLNMSKFYIKANKVIQNVHDINAKKQLNKYVKQVINNNQKTAYQGPFIRRISQRKNKQNIQIHQEPCNTKTQKQIGEEQNDPKAEIKLMQLLKIQKIKNNCKNIFHQRNIYAFLGHLAQDLVETHKNSYSYCLAFLLIKKAICRISNLKLSIKKRQFKQIQQWNQFQKSSQYNQIITFLTTQQDIFNRFYQKLTLKVFQQGTLSKFQDDLMISGKYTLEQTHNKIIQRVSRQYISKLLKQQKNINQNLSIQIIKLLDSFKLQTKFSQIDFDFAEYYLYFTETQQSTMNKTAILKAQQFIKSK